MWQGSTPAGRRVADVKIQLLRHDEEAITGRVVYSGEYRSNGGRVVVEDGPYLLIIWGSGTRTGIIEDGGAADALSMLDDGERGLASVVIEDELISGCTAAPRLADGAAAEYVLGRQPDEDLFHDEPLGQVVKDGRAAAVPHANCALERKMTKKNQTSVQGTQNGDGRRIRRKNKLLRRSIGVKETTGRLSQEDYSGERSSSSEGGDFHRRRDGVPCGSGQEDDRGTLGRENPDAKLVMEEDMGWAV
jgi:hypothetical protein